ncbi:MAG UNVERIFIED_CONTAM: HPP family protein [Microcystis novacekii LVE1205-3]|jgi:CBS-domain-containing membrane protein
MAPFGATSVSISLGKPPDSPLAQPPECHRRECLRGACQSNTSAFFRRFTSSRWHGGIGNDRHYATYSGTLHPPAGAVALVVMMTQPDWQFSLRPTFSRVRRTPGSVRSVSFNNLAEERTDPKHWL